MLGWCGLMIFLTVPCLMVFGFFFIPPPEAETTGRGLDRNSLLLQTYSLYVFKTIRQALGRHPSRCASGSDPELGWHNQGRDRYRTGWQGQKYDCYRRASHFYWW